MVNFIIVDDQEIFIEYLETLICFHMQSKAIKFRFYRFLEYNEQFEKMIESDLTNKFYFLDIVTPESNGIDMARKIRTTDKTCEILFMTGHDDNYAYTNFIIRSNIKPLGFLYKEELAEFLPEKLDYFIEEINDQQKIKIEDNHATYFLYVNDITYITKRKNSREVIVYTIKGSIEIKKNFNQLEKEFLKMGNFIKTHRTCIANLSQIRSIDWKDSFITFYNGEKTYLIARQYKKALKEQFAKRQDNKEIDTFAK